MKTSPRLPSPCRRLRLLLLAVLPIVLASCSEPRASGGASPPPAVPVTVATVTTTPVVRQEVDFPGRLQGFREVEVRAQVAGILLQRNYREGQGVEQGETLFQIDPAPYELALRDAEAEVDAARAALLQAERDWERSRNLLGTQAISELEHDLAAVEHASALARVAKAEVAVDDAARLLRYTCVQAPVTGVAGMEAVSEGNLLRQGDLLTRLTQLDPLHLHFSLPEPDALRLLASRKDRGGEDAISVQLLTAEGNPLPHSGQIDFSAPRINERTGALALRASFPNADHRLLPGQFVRVRLVLAEYHNVVLIDPSVVGEGEQGPRVFVLDNENRARVRPVKLGPLLDGQQLILAGLNAGDRLVVNGHASLQPGRQAQPLDRAGGAR